MVGNYETGCTNKKKVAFYFRQHFLTNEKKFGYLLDNYWLSYVVSMVVERILIMEYKCQA